MTGLHNWTDNYRFRAARLHQPGSIDELRRIVVRAGRVHAIGSRHSFNGVGDTEGDLIDLGAIDPGFTLSADRRRVTVCGGTTYAVLNAWLRDQGLALHNTASLPHITVAGAISTGTHGSGDRLGNLPTAVAALEVVTASGDLHLFERGHADFDGAVVALGALGVVARVTLDIQPTYDVRQDAYEGLRWEAVLTDLNAVMGAG